MSYFGKVGIHRAIIIIYYFQAYLHSLDLSKEKEFSYQLLSAT